MGETTVSIVSLARYRRKRDWDDQEIAEFLRVRDTLVNAGFSVSTDRGLTDEGDPWFIFLREGSDEVIAHFARIDGQVVADSSALEEPLHGGELRGVLERTFRQYALLPMRNGNGETLLLHPAALLTAFVATAFLQLEHGEQNLALSASGAIGLAAGDAAGFDAAGSDAAGDDAAVVKPDTAGADKGDDGLKGLLSRLPALLGGGGGGPANASGRAVSFGDGVNTLETSTGQHVLLTALVAALGALQTVDVAAADPDGDDGGPTVDAAPVPIVYAADLADAANAGPDPHALAEARRADASGREDAAAAEAHLPEPPAEPDLAGGASASEGQRVTMTGDALELTARSERVPITFAADTVEPARASSPDDARDAMPSANALSAASGGSGGGDTASDSDSDASGGGDTASDSDSDASGGGSGGLDPSDILFPDDSAERERGQSETPGDTAPSGGSGGAIGEPTLDDILFGAHDGSDPALGEVRDFIETGGRDPIPIEPVRYSQFDDVSRAFGLAEPGAADFVLFESDTVPYLGFAFRPEVIFVERNAISEWNAAVVDGSHSRTMELANGGEITLVGVVNIVEDAPHPGM